MVGRSKSRNNCCTCTDFCNKTELLGLDSGRLELHYTPLTRSSKHRAIIEQTFIKYMQNTCAERVL